MLQITFLIPLVIDVYIYISLYVLSPNSMHHRFMVNVQGITFFPVNNLRAVSVQNVGMTLSFSASLSLSPELPLDTTL